MAGLTTEDGCVFPALGLQSEAAIATSCSPMYRGAIRIVKQELEANSSEHPNLNIGMLVQDLEMDPVMEAASVRLACRVLHGLVCVIVWSPDKRKLAWRLCTLRCSTLAALHGIALYCCRRSLLMARHGPLNEAHPRRTKEKLRSKRKEMWAWFIEVTIFRTLCRRRVALRRLRLPSQCDIDKMGPTAQGQRHAAEFLANQFADNTASDGSRCSGFGRYTRNVSTTTGSKADFVSHKHEVWQLQLHILAFSLLPVLLYSLLGHAFA